MIHRCPKCGSVMVSRHSAHGDFLGCIKFPVCKGTKPLSKYKSNIVLATPLRQSIKYSHYQERIFDGIGSGSSNIVVEAVPGSGKTTTLVEGLKRTRKDSRVLFCAFNRHIRDELKNRAPAHVHVKTLHQLGLGAVMRHFNWKYDGFKPDEEKVWNLMKDILPSDDRHFMPQLKRLVSLAKYTLADVYDPLRIIQLIDRYDIDCNGYEDKLLYWLPLILEASFEAKSSIDFDDMIWFPIQYNMAMPAYDYIFVDERQDLNETQITMLSKAAVGRTIAVGDSHQSIYGFAGADVDSLQKMISSLNATVLPLSICYRCPKSHVLHAKEIFPEIEYADNAPDGIMEDLSEQDVIKQLQDKDLVLCRLNAPLVKLCYRLIRDGKKVVMRGRDIGANLLIFIEKLGGSDVVELMKNMEKYKEAEIARLSALNRSDRIGAIQDKCDTLDAFCEGMTDVQEVQRRIAMIFDDDSKAGIIASSIHRAKGGEADNVFILHRELMPHKLARQPWQQLQEQNLIYVSRTRSKNRLVYVN